jgi:type II secretory pathway component PulK
MINSRLAYTARQGEQGSTLVIVLWIAIGLVSLTLYFAQSMLSEVRASDHRVEGLAAEQAVEGGLRYAMALLGNQLTNGYSPDPGSYLCEAVAIDEKNARQEAGARFWFIGRDTNSTSPSKLVSFGLVDEGSKINLNAARSNVLYYLTDWDIDVTEAILDWRNTNGPGTTIAWYGMQVPSYECKQAPFETVEELRLVLGITPEWFGGEDLNRNGVLDPNETDEDRDGLATSGLLDLVTVYSREPNTYNNGTPRVNIRLLTSASQDFSLLLQESISATRANIILQQLGLSGGGGGGQQTFNSPLELYRRGGFTLEEFAEIADKITTVEGEFVEGRINVNTAPARVLSCLPGLAESPDLVDLLVNYRLTNPTRLSSIAWIVEALGQSNQEAISQLERRDMFTTRSYQFSADIAATGAYGRGYRRTRFVIDTALGSPRVVYRQDLTHLGWALGKETRDLLVPSNSKNGSIAFN